MNRRKPGWSNDDRALRLALLAGLLAGALLGLVTANLAWLGGVLVRLT